MEAEEMRPTEESKAHVQVIQVILAMKLDAKQSIQVTQVKRDMKDKEGTDMAMETAATGDAEMAMADTITLVMKAVTVEDMEAVVDMAVAEADQ